LSIKIFINARFLTQTITGVQRYATQLVLALDSLIENREVNVTQYSFVLLAPHNVKHKLHLKHITIQCIGHLTGHLWEQLELPFYSQNGLLISLCNTGPILKHQQIVTIHDAVVFGFPQAYSFIFQSWYKVLWVSLGINARQILTVSFFSKKEIIKYCKINEKKVQVIYEGCKHILDVGQNDVPLDIRDAMSRPFVLAVSSFSSNKNFSSIVQAIEILGNINFDIVIVGSANPAIFRHSPLPFSKSVKYLGYVSDEELRALYENASCFVYPSLYEGFGLPPLEAMACGCPVIVSNAASLPEICGAAALYCDPYSPEDIATKIALLMADENLREELQHKGQERAKLFSWEKCARETFAVIKKALF